jgi:23S rRNA (cytidine1920-2'-O)/16S rRNA (cytidine1409-2'-O)-methyltransferase
MERTNARDLPPLPEACDLATLDVSFIGLEKVLPAVCHSLKPGGQIVALVKPQFQATRAEVGKKGVVKDVQVHAAVIGRIVAWAVEHELRLLSLTTSPLLGPAGNKEFFLHLLSQPDDEKVLMRSGAEHPGRLQSIELDAHKTLPRVSTVR